jgi:beta-1,4-N-acetylglucosaminyltransferase
MRGVHDAWKHDRERTEVLLVCSSGGHLVQLVSLAPAWEGLTRVWVSFDKSDVRSLLADENVIHAHGPTNRSIVNLFRNLWLAQRTLRRHRPRVLVTTGAGVAVPFAWLARLSGTTVVYVESFTRIDSISLSCRLIRPFADRVYVQWPEAAHLVKGARYAGNVFSDGA